MEDNDTMLFNCLRFGAVVLWRALTSGVALSITLAVLVIILLAHRRKAWGNFPKRMFLGIILSTGAHFLASLVGVDYSYQYLKGRYKTVCRGLGYLQHYTATLTPVFYSVWVWAHLFHSTLPVLYAILPQYNLGTRLKSKLDNISLRMKRVTEIVLFIFLSVSPAFLNTWEPFLSHVTSYGSYGPWCWFELPLPTNVSRTNCSNDTEWPKASSLYSASLPYAVAMFVCSSFMVGMIIVWCGLYFKFRKSAIGNNIAKVFPTILLLPFATIVVAVTLTVSTAMHGHHSFTHWITAAVENTILSTALLVVATFFEHFPVLICVCRCIKVVKKSQKSNERVHSVPNELVDFDHEERDLRHPILMSDQMQNTCSSTYYTARDACDNTTDQGNTMAFAYGYSLPTTYGTINYNAANDTAN